MPIRSEMRHLYPPPREWKSIRERILARAGNACEKCRAPNGVIIARAVGSYMLEDGAVHDEDSGVFQGYARGSEYPTKRWTRVVLTIAHVDHDPRNNDESNLRAWCQLHHLRHDTEEHAKNAAATRSRKRDELSGQTNLWERQCE